jgi:hypothetical protein
MADESCFKPSARYRQEQCQDQARPSSRAGADRNSAHGYVERRIVHEAAEAVRYNGDAEGPQQSAQSPLIFRACRDPQTSIRTMRLGIICKRCGAVAQIEADADQPHPINKSGRPYLVPELCERLAECNADRRAGRIDELDDHDPSEVIFEHQLAASHIDQANRGDATRMLDNRKPTRTLRREGSEAIGTLPQGGTPYEGNGQGSDSRS